MLSEKLRLPNYFSSATQLLCAPESANHNNGTLNAVLAITHLKNSNHLNLTLSVADANQATACMNKIIEEMDAKQSIISKPLLSQKQSQLDTLNAQIKLMDESATEIQALSKRRFKDNQFEASVLLIAIAQNFSEDMHQLQTKQQDLKQSLLAQNTHDVRLVSPLWTPKKTAGPAAWLVLLLAGLLGWVIEFAIRQFICDSKRYSPASP